MDWEAEGLLDEPSGLVGDNWNQRYNKHHPEGLPDPDRQLNVINARLSALVAVDPDRRALAGDQLHLDFDLSEANVPVGTRLALGGAVIEVTCKAYDLFILIDAATAEVYTREALLDKIWGYDYFGGDRTVDVHIRRLRSKIEVAGHAYIGTVRNIGYRFMPSA